jgi:hypothetical protein
MRGKVRTTLKNRKLQIPHLSTSPPLSPGLDTPLSPNAGADIDAGMDTEPVSSASSYKTPIMMRTVTEEKKRELISTCIDVLKEFSSSNQINQCSFTLYVAEKVKKFEPRTRTIAEKRISDITFELKMNDMISIAPQEPSPYPIQMNTGPDISQLSPNEAQTRFHIPYLRNAVQYNG